MPNANNHNLTLMGFDLPGKIYRSPMPYSTFDHNRTTMAEMVAAKIGLVVILVEEPEWWTNAKMDLPKEYARYGIRVIHCPIQDFYAPRDTPRFLKTVDQVIEEAKAGTNVAVHCLAGIGRTGTLMAVLANRLLGINGTQAIFWVRQYVPDALENEIQMAYVVVHSR